MKSDNENSAKGTFSKRQPSNHRDALTGVPGAHPVGTGVGAAAGGAATGAAISVVAGPVGTLAGMAAGAVAGGLIGKSVAEKIDPTVAGAYWRTHYSDGPQVDKGRHYERYQAAYRTGHKGHSSHADKSFVEVEDDLQQRYYSTKGQTDLGLGSSQESASRRVESFGRPAGCGESRLKNKIRNQGKPNMKSSMMKSSVKNKIEGTAHEIKEIAGRATNNPDLEERGREEKVAGRVERKVGDVKKVFGR